MKNDGVAGIEMSAAHAQSPPSQIWPPEQAVVQSPQNSSLVVTSVHWPPHTMFGALHTGGASIAASTAASIGASMVASTTTTVSSPPPPQAARAIEVSRAGTSDANFMCTPIVPARPALGEGPRTGRD